MSDIYSILSSAYTATPATPASNTPYTNVDPTLYQGTWSGTYSNNNQKFELTVSEVNGFRAQVKYQSGSTVQYQSVLIKDGSFRIGDTKFSLNANGGASVGTIITSPVDGSTTLIQGSATLDT
ncbi:hypothetical protein [Nitrobacter sp. JJSN]|jgi:hypothetical protein|uniref:hypothetical protein n=1 Tax=Nitrobacter sp. JJSN TaxID=3453033 RepID=UPI003F777077